MARIAAILGTILLLWCGSAMSATIGLSVPLAGDYAGFGEQFRAGAQQAITDAATGHELVVEDDGCSAEGAEQAASNFMQKGTRTVFGFLCNDSAMAAANTLRSSGIPVIVAGAQSLRLVKDREREEWNVWRLSPGDDYAAAVAANAILEKWRQTPFAIVDDGTIYGRRFSDSLRQKLQEQGLEPQIIDTFRTGLSTQAALVRRLRRSGVDAVFIAAVDPNDLVIILNDSTRLNLPFDFITTEALRVLPFLNDAGLFQAPLAMIDWPDALPQNVSGSLPDGAVSRHYLMGYAAAQVALHVADDSPDGKPVFPANRVFDTILGNVSFNADGSASFNPYRLLQWDGSKFIPSQNPEDR